MAHTVATPQPEAGAAGSSVYPPSNAPACPPHLGGRHAVQLLGRTHPCGREVGGGGSGRGEKEGGSRWQGREDLSIRREGRDMWTRVGRPETLIILLWL